MNNDFLEKRRILSQSVLGFEFEFFSALTKSEISSDLGKFLGKKIHVSYAYHSKFRPTSDVFKLEPDFSGGEKMVELITGPIPYDESMIVLSRIMSWIRENGWTSEKCAFQFNISFNEWSIKHKDKMSQIDKLKFILGFDEDYIYDRFGNRRQNIYARSIRDLSPLNKFTIVEKIRNIDNKMFKLPSTKYYGVNFKKIVNEYIEIRYLGGRGYEKKMKDIQEIIDYTIIYTHNILNNSVQYTESDIKQLESMLKRHRLMIQAFNNIDVFRVNYPNLTLLVDLKNDPEIIKAVFPVMRDKLYEIIFESNITNGVLNYDSDISRFQLRSSKSSQCWSVRSMDIINCEITYGNLNNCRIIDTVIEDCILDECNIMSSNEIKGSKLIKCTILPGNDINNSFVDSRFNVMDGNLHGGILRSGRVGVNAKISDETEITSDRSWDYTLPRNPAKTYRFKDVNHNNNDIDFNDENAIENNILKNDRSRDNKRN